MNYEIEHWSNGNYKSIKHFIRNDSLLIPHREDGPAQLWFNHNGYCHTELWYIYGAPFRNDRGPHIVTYYYDNDKPFVRTKEWIYIEGINTIDDLRDIYDNHNAMMNLINFRTSRKVEEYTRNQKLISTIYYNGMKFHKENEPAINIWYTNGNKSLETWCIEGNEHRYGLPAKTTWRRTGQIKKQEWFEYGLRHNSIGPAVISNHNYEWFIRGNSITYEVRKWIRNLNLPRNYDEWSNELKMLFKMTWDD